jgi:cytochrome c-type biogenesis protein CcmH/NrfF
MVLLWTVPVLAVAAAAVVVLVVAESMQDSSRALRDEVMRLASLRDLVAEVRAEAERLRR